MLDEILVVASAEKSQIGSGPSSFGCVRVVVSVAEAQPLFNGSPGDIRLVFISFVPGAPLFIRELHSRFPRLVVVGLLEDRMHLSNAGCSFFVSWKDFPVSAFEVVKSCY